MLDIILDSAIIISTLCSAAFLLRASNVGLPEEIEISGAFGGALGDITNYRPWFSEVSKNNKRAAFFAALAAI